MVSYSGPSISRPASSPSGTRQTCPQAMKQGGHVVLPTLYFSIIVSAESGSKSSRCPLVQ